MSTLKIFMNHCTNASKRFVQEICDWWQIAKLERKIKHLSRHHENVSRKNNGITSSDETANASSKNYNDEIEKLEKQIKVLKERVWALTPTLLFASITFAFFLAIVFLTPRSDLKLASSQIEHNRTQTSLAPVAIAPIIRKLEYHIEGYEVVKTAMWLHNKLYFGGDGGLSFCDLETATTTLITALPNSMFVRDLKIDKRQQLIIAGYGGIYALNGQNVRSIYEGAALPIELINKIALTNEGNILIGTIGHGLFIGRNEAASFLLGTKETTPCGFAFLNRELWLAHERGVLKGDGNTFEALQIPVLGNRIINCFASSDFTIYLGTNDGLLVGTKSLHDWTWTLIDPGEPSQIHDMAVVDGRLLICAEEGLFRYYEGNFEKLTGNIGQTAMAIERERVATVGPDIIVISIFSNKPVAASP